MSIARIKKNDTVIVTKGNDAGKTGTVLNVNSSKGTVTVSGLNMVKKTMRRNPNNGTGGGIIDREAPIKACNVMPFDADKKKGTRIARVKDGDKTVRKSKASGKILN